MDDTVDPLDILGLIATTLLELDDDELKDEHAALPSADWLAFMTERLSVSFADSVDAIPDDVA